MRFLVDANLGTHIERTLLELGHEVERAVRVLPPDTSDPDVARYARSRGQHIVTADRGFAGQLQAGQTNFPHALITLCIEPTTLPTEAVAMLNDVLESYTIEDGMHYIIQPGRVRVTVLSGGPH